MTLLSLDGFADLAIKNNDYRDDQANRLGSAATPG
jgi:hypothetical protein